MHADDTGSRFELLMASTERGVLECTDDAPAAGTRLVLYGTDLDFRQVRLTVKVLSIETGGSKLLNLRWLQVAARTAKQLRNAIHKLWGESLSIPSEFDKLTTALWLSFDPSTRRVTTLPAPPPQETWRPSQSSRRRRSARRIIDITSKRGVDDRER